ncbi:GNAT family N-acetyltransferase [Micromonospora sp. NBC_00362]|uniref:GNAT family N-acetyltransferase n=1 Tax=unclassified Micromonospora TaxID=2617518 RepID=UPI00224FC1AE|nr:GNAT family N-acetyltransferase [Micromonospora sp. NBC_00362]MCX5115712.1 GNAT family N-acetyltransferase [Micromonospora sp. NBC_00362]WTI05966.1 GNAT family N-acetyltransferase [Micromonospora sp. NBC_00821]
MDRTLAEILEAAAYGHFPPPDGGTTVVSQPSRRDAGVIAFTGHSVVFTDEDPQWVRRTLATLDCDSLAATMNPRFLGALLERTRRCMDTIDLLTVASCLAGPPPLPLTELADAGHPREVRSRRRRDDIRVWAAEGGVVVLGRGVAGRWEAAVEVDDERRHRGLGRALATAARHLVPDGQPVWAQQAAGNARSVRAFQAAGFRPVGAEALLLPT